jgi:hypothetical protein
MVNFYNTSLETLNLMKEGLFEDVHLKIQTDSLGKKTYSFISGKDAIVLQPTCQKIYEKVSSFFSGSTKETKWVQGKEVEVFYNKGVARLRKCLLALSKASYLAQGSLNTCCSIMDSQYACESFSNHHFAKPHYECLNKIFLESPESSFMTFDEWLEQPSGIAATQSYARSINSSVDELQVAQLNSTQRKAYEVTFQRKEEGLTLHLSDAPIVTETFGVPLTEEELTMGERKSIIFVLGLDNKLYVNEHKISRFHHSSFFSGKPVACAGEIKTDANGKIVEITDKSGHYKPSNNQLLKMLSFLEKQGVNLSEVTLVKKPKRVMRDAQGIYAGRWNAQEFLASKGTCSPTADNISEDYY